MMLPGFILPLDVAQDGWVWGVFSSLRSTAVSGASQSVGAAFAIGCIIVAFKMIRIAYDLMSDEQGGGMGSIRLSQIIGPLLILFAIQASGTLLSTFDGVVTGVTSGISHSYSSASVGLMYAKTADAVREATNNVIGEENANAYREIENRPLITQEEIRDIQSTGMNGSSILGTMIFNKIKKNRDKEAQAQKIAESQAAEDVDDAQDEGQKGLVANVRAIRRALDRLMQTEKTANDIKDGKWRFSFKDGTAVASIAVVVYNALFFIIECFAEIVLCLLAMFFPWTLVVSLVGAWGRAYMDWAGRYLVVSFWKVAAVGVNYVTQMAMGATLKYQALQALKVVGGDADSAVGSLAAGITVSAIIAVAGIFALLHVNDIATAIIPAGSGGGMGSMGAAAGGFAGSVANTPGKAATGIQGIVANQKGIASANAQKAFQSNVTSALGKLTE